MLKILINGQDQVIQCDDYYVRQLSSGLDEVIFTVSIYDPLYPYITEETKVTDIDGQTYLVKQIDAGKTDAKVIAQLDLNDWKALMHIRWGNGIKTISQTVEMVKPSGWTVVDNSGLTGRLSINGNLTSYEVCVECCDAFGVYIRWNNKTKVVTITDKALAAPVGAFVTRELNMTELNFKGKSNDIITRLYAYGVDDLSFSSINGGKPYVENHSYTSAVICGYWKDERYKYPETLLEAAQKKLAEMAVPVRSYSCSVVDLRASDPDKYGFLDFSMFTTATLIDDIKGFSMDYQVVERHTYPYYPEKNEVIFDSAPLRITKELNNTKELLSQKTDQEQVKTEVDRATGVLQTGKSGYVVIGRNSDGYANEIYFLDRPSLDDAVKVLRINQAGIGFSSHGVSGPYYQSWTLDGHFALGGVNNAYGDFEILDSNGRPLGEWNKDGLKFYDSSQNILMLLNHTGLFLKDANGGTLAQLTNQGLNVYKGTISGVTIDIARGNEVGLYCDGETFRFGDFEVNTDYGRQVIESTDEMTGMGGAPDDEGGLFLWAGYYDDNDYRFVVNEAGAYTMYDGQAYNIGQTLAYILENCCSGGGGDCPSDGGCTTDGGCSGYDCMCYGEADEIADGCCTCHATSDACGCDRNECVDACPGEDACSGYGGCSCESAQCGPGDGL
jgi:hypothetical protein